jgi:hypothetical protein
MNWSLFGRPVHSGAAKLLIVLLLAVWIPLTLPLHLIVWLFNGRGFIVHKGRRSYAYEPPAWAAFGSLAAAAVVALVVLF